MAKNTKAETTAETPAETTAELTVGQLLTADTPVRDRTIGSKDGPSFTVKVPTPFAAGHPITAGQAAVLNQTLAENVGNNLRARLTTGQVDPDGKPTDTPFTPDEAQAIVDEYVGSYQFGAKRGGGGTRVTDPVEREARKLARQAAAGVVKAKGMKQSDVDMGAITEAIFAKNEEKLREQAQVIVDRTIAAAEAIEGIGAGIEIPSKPEEPAAG